MNDIHESNRACWNGWAKWWGERRDAKGLWRKCHRAPTLVLSPGEMQALGDVAGRDVCVLASGDNEVAFALAGMGAHVTSVDISEGQLRIAEERAGGRAWLGDYLPQIRLIVGRKRGPIREEQGRG